MNEDKLFHYLVSRLQTRETSTNTLAAIASSASLIFLALFFQDQIQGDTKELIWWVGVITPIVGFAYFEITFATQQSWDYNVMINIIRKDYPKQMQKELEKIIYGKNRIFVLPKMFLWRILLMVPFVGWLSIDRTRDEMIMIIAAVFILITLLIMRIELKKEKEMTTLQNGGSSKNNNSQDSES